MDVDLKRENTDNGSAARLLNFPRNQKLVGERPQPISRASGPEVSNVTPNRAAAERLPANTNPCSRMVRVPEGLEAGDSRDREVQDHQQRVRIPGNTLGAMDLEAEVEFRIKKIGRQRRASSVVAPSVNPSIKEVPQHFQTRMSSVSTSS